MASKLNQLNFIIIILVIVILILIGGGVSTYFYLELKKEKAKICPVQQTCHIVKEVQVKESRDNAVLNDPLYPPLNRSARDVPIPPMPRNRNTDSFRLVGYLVDQSDKNYSWKIFAMEKYKGGRSQFYATPTNRDIDMKVFLSNDIIVGRDKFIDLYNLPDKVNIQHPMFSKGTYDVVQLPMSDFSTNYY